MPRIFNLSLHLLTPHSIRNHYLQQHCFSMILTKAINSWASAIRDSSSPQQALHLYTQMQQQSIPYTSHTILFTLNSISRSQPKSPNNNNTNLTLIRHLHAQILKIGFTSHVYVGTSLLRSYVVTSFSDACDLFEEMPKRNIVTLNTMISGYSKYGDPDIARLLFNGMLNRDLTTWSAMIAAYMNAKNWDEGLELFGEMMTDESLTPDQVTLVPILSACTHMGFLGLLMGKSVHCYIEKNGWDLNVELGTVVVDMYMKCGSLESAFRVFERMNERNVITWSAMICGFAQHGNGKMALSLFARMKREGVRPNEVTFTGVLSACAHTGLVEEGRRHFSSMIEEYRLEPRIQHYGCMVDLLGKSGRLEEAYDVIQSMRLEPNMFIWTSLLAACRVHKRFDIAERVIQQVLAVAEPEKDGGVYTLISDLYASNGKYEEAQKVRELMVDQHVKKARGSSFIRTGIARHDHS